MSRETPPVAGSKTPHRFPTLVAWRRLALGVPTPLVATTRALQFSCIDAFDTKRSILWALLDAVSAAYPS